jgi:hypothetical protein
VRVHLLCPDMKKCWNERVGLRSRRWKAADLDCCGALAMLVCGGLSASGLIDALYLMLCCIYRYSYSEPWTESAKVLPRCPRRMFDDDVTSAFNITIINASLHLPLPLSIVPLRLLNLKRRSNSMFLATTASLGTLQAPNTGDLFFVHFLKALSRWSFCDIPRRQRRRTMVARRRFQPRPSDDDGVCLRFTLPLRLHCNSLCQVRITVDGVVVATRPML